MAAKMSKRLGSADSRAFLQQIRERGPRMLPAMGVATALGVLWYAALFFLEGGYLHSLFYLRGWIPFVCTWLFFLALSLLGFKLLRIRQESGASSSKVCEGLLAIAEEGGGQEAEGRVHALVKSRPREANLVLNQRLRQGVLQILKGSNPREVASVMVDQSDADYHMAESSYFLVKFLVWVVPILGFVGTVVGIASAIGRFDSVVASSNSLQDIQVQMGAITGSLGLAFETTLIALVMSALMMLALALVQKREEDMLATVDQFVLEHLVAGATGSRGIGPPADAQPTPGGAGLGEVLANLQQIQEAHNRELQRLSQTFEKNAEALGSARELSQSLAVSQKLQGELGQAIQGFREVTERYVATLRKIYNLGE